MRRFWKYLVPAVSGICISMTLAPVQAEDSTKETLAEISKLKVGPRDWPQWGGSPRRNNVPADQKIPVEWDIATGKNVRWSMPLGSETYGNPVVANGKAYVGTNNGNGYLKRYPSSVDLGVLVCFDEKDGKFLWQHSSEKLPTGRVNDWPHQGICSAPLVDGDRLWFVSSRGEVVCLDTEGFYDGENDGPFDKEKVQEKDEADVVWSFDMMGALKVSQHNMCSCSVTCAGELLFVNTSNGVDEGHKVLPEADAPSFICLNRTTGMCFGPITRQVPMYCTVNGHRQRMVSWVVSPRCSSAVAMVTSTALLRKVKTEKPSCCGSLIAIRRTRSTR